MNRREGFDAMNVIVLRKRDLNYKLKLVSNEDWEKRFIFFWAVAWEKTTFVVRFSLLMTTFQSVFWSSLYFLLTLLFARYSPLYVSLFLFSFAFPSPHFAYFSFLSNFLAFFSTRFTPFTSCCLWFLCLFLFHSKPFLHELELYQFSPVEKALALSVLLLCELIKIANTENYCSTTS